MSGVFKRYIVTAFNIEGGAFRYMAETEGDAQRQAAIFSDMGLVRVSSRAVLWDTRKNCIA